MNNGGLAKNGLRHLCDALSSEINDNTLATAVEIEAMHSTSTQDSECNDIASAPQHVDN